MRLLLASVLLFFSVGLLRAAAPSRPNILLILADDLGYGDVSCYNPDRGKIRTPHLDRLAAEGIRFTDAHTSSGVCSPSRYALLTGRYHWRTGRAGIVPPYGPPMIAATRLTLPALLKRHGYRTAAIGKWHLGWEWPFDAATAATLWSGPAKPLPPPAPAQLAVWREVFARPIGSGPVTRGFDSYFGTDVPNWAPYAFIEDDRVRGTPSELLPAALVGNNLSSHHGPALPGWKLEDILPALVRRAEEFLADAARRPEPFFLYLPLTSPHTPLSVSAEWRGRSGLDSAYADFVLETDAAVGRVLAALEKSGRARDTLVVFSSDNGCASYIGVDALERRGHFPSGPFRGYKTDAWEGGHRVPFLVRWPGVAPAGRVEPRLTHQADVIATIAEITGTKLPADAAEDSFSFLAALLGRDTPPRPHAISQSSGGVLALRRGDWKLIFGHGTDAAARRDNDPAPARLYHLGRDPGETKNLLTAEPAVAAELSALMQQLVRDGRSTSGPAQPNDTAIRFVHALPGSTK